MVNEIGLRFNQVKDGDEVYYYPWLSTEDGSHSEPIKTKLRSDPFPIHSGQNSGCSEACFIEGIAGYVLMSHISKEYYPEQKKVKRTKYQEYLHADYGHSFADFLGITRPEWQYYSTHNSNQVRMVSRKTGIKSDFFNLKKDAKADYKNKLKLSKTKKKW